LGGTNALGFELRGVFFQEGTIQLFQGKKGWSGEAKKRGQNLVNANTRVAKRGAVG